MNENNGNPTQHSADQVRIVVGTDGSECAGRAVDFAAHEAARWGALLEVVSVYGYIPDSGLAPVPMEPFEDAAHSIITAAAARVSALEPSVVVKGEAIFGISQQVLVEASQGAVLLVVGSRGRGELKSLVLGSVSAECVHHVCCPITIVH
jgi:nucleotide-binding universal stress UspA family protein